MLAARPPAIRLSFASYFPRRHHLLDTPVSVTMNTKRQRQKPKLWKFEKLETWQLRMHCNLRPPEPRQSFPALITTPCQVCSRWTYPLPYYSVFTANALVYAVTLTFDHVTLIVDIWSWTFALYLLWRDETLYQIWTQSSNPRRSYCHFNICPNDLERRVNVLRSALR